MSITSFFTIFMPFFRIHTLTLISRFLMLYDKGIVAINASGEPLRKIIANSDFELVSSRLAKIKAAISYLYEG